MKSSAFKLFLLIAIIAIPLLLWATITQPQDVRSRATDDTTPTATTTTTPTATVTPTATMTPTTTPTPTNSPPRCLGLSAYPGAGAKPLTVNFACAGYDGNNDITAAEFGYGAGQKSLVEKNVGQYGSLTSTFTYTTAGTYNVTCRVRDNNNAFSDYPSSCTYSVVVADNVLTPTPIRTPAPTIAVPTNTPFIEVQPTFIPVPTAIIATPTPTPQPQGWWTNEKIMQLVTMVIISGVTIIIALLLHAFFDKR